MRLYFVRAKNVHHFHPTRFEVIRDKRAVATPPDRFRAHDATGDGFQPSCSFRPAAVAP